MTLIEICIFVGSVISILGIVGMLISMITYILTDNEKCCDISYIMLAISLFGLIIAFCSFPLNLIGFPVVS